MIIVMGIFLVDDTVVRFISEVGSVVTLSVLITSFSGKSTTNCGISSSICVAMVNATARIFKNKNENFNFNSSIH